MRFSITTQSGEEQSSPVMMSQVSVSGLSHRFPRFLGCLRVASVGESMVPIKFTPNTASNFMRIVASMWYRTVAFW
jgi:hypothetical protein